VIEHIAADPISNDEGPGRGLDAVLLLEGVGFLARRLVMILDLEAFAFQ
tara:strand:- start:294 stop:440 length:147 start_codon:yes stop_codon:yes gene_type:complete